MTADNMENARKALERGDFEEAHKIEASKQIQQAAFSLLVSNIFTSHCRNKQYQKAVALGKAFRLPDIKIQEVVEKHFAELIAGNAFDRAVEWGNRNGLSKDKLHAAADKFCKTCLLKGEIEKALEIKKDYSIPDTALADVARDAMNVVIRKKDYESALALMEYSGVPNQLRSAVITGVLEKYAAADNREKLKSMVEKHKFLTEEFFGNLKLHEQLDFVELITIKIMKKYLLEDQFEFLASFINETGILSVTPQNPQLMKIRIIAYSALCEIHKTYFIRENIAEAVKLAEDFHLTDSAVPKEF